MGVEGLKEQKKNVDTAKIWNRQEMETYPRAGGTREAAGHQNLEAQKGHLELPQGVEPQGSLCSAERSWRPELTGAVGGA